MSSIDIAGWRGRAGDWFEQRSERERLLIAAAATLAALVALFTLVWTPIQAARDAALAEIRADDTVIARLRTAGPQLAARRDVLPGSPATVVAMTAAEAGLTIQRLEPAAGGVNVTLEDAEFDKVMRWLAAVERQSNLTIGELKLDRRPPPGVVNVQLTLVGR